MAQRPSLRKRRSADWGGVNAICTHTELIADHQECEDAEDGYQFLVMHRHMIQSLRQAFPQHAALFEGFPSFATEASDVPAAWQDRFGTGWTQEVQDTAGCTASSCNNQVMPPTGKVTLTDSELGILRQWIVDGAPPPTP